MDKRTRVFNAMDKKEVDHVPVGFWYHFSGAQAVGEPCVQAHLDYYRDIDLDVIKIMCDSYFHYPLPSIVTASDWKKLEPLGPNHAFIQEQVWRAKRIVEEAGNEFAIFYNMFAPFSFIRFSASDELVMRHLQEDENAVRHALDIISMDCATLARLLIQEAGCDGIYLCVQGGEPWRMGEEDYKRIIAPSDLYVLEHANRYSEYNIMHCCGYTGEKNNLNLWKDYPAKVVNWAVYVENLPLTTGRALFGNKCCMGGFQTLHQPDDTYKGVIHTGTKEEVQAFTRDIILSFGKTGLILGGDCTVDNKMSHDRLRWVVEAARSL